LRARCEVSGAWGLRRTSSLTMYTIVRHGIRAMDGRRSLKLKDRYAITYYEILKIKIRQS